MYQHPELLLSVAHDIQRDRIQAADRERVLARIRQRHERRRSRASREHR